MIREILQLKRTKCGNSKISRAMVLPIYQQEILNDFHDEVTDVAGGIQCVTRMCSLLIGPDMWRLQDTNEDGVLDDKFDKPWLRCTLGLVGMACRVQRKGQTEKSIGRSAILVQTSPRRRQSLVAIPMKAE